MYEIEFYKDKDGKSDVADYIKIYYASPFYKKTPKTPKREPEKAKRNLQDYLETLSISRNLQCQAACHCTSGVLGSFSTN